MAAPKGSPTRTGDCQRGDAMKGRTPCESPQTTFERPRFESYLARRDEWWKDRDDDDSGYILSCWVDLSYLARSD